MKKPNIIIFIADQWRPDYTGIGGHPIVHTPNFDSFAQNGIVFSQAFSTSSVCGPSRCSLFSGWYPHSRGHRSQKFLLGEGEPHLFKYMKDAGYHTAWGGKNDMLTASEIRKTIDTRFKYGNRNNGDTNLYSVSDPRYYSFYRGKLDIPLEEASDTKTVRQAQRFLENPPEEPFCMLVNVSFPHPPYCVPEPYYSMYNPDDMDRPIECDYSKMPNFVGKLHQLSRLGECDEEHLRKIRALYCGMITMIDDLLGDLLYTLDQSCLADKTAVFVLSDHGNFVCDYGLPEKWFTAMQDVILKIPLAVRIPWIKSSGISSALTEHIDVFATILELAGIERIWPHFGNSLIPIIKGEANANRDMIFAEGGSSFGYDLTPVGRHGVHKNEPSHNYYPNKIMLNEFAESTISRTVAVRNEKWKYVWRQNEHDELYDLDTDKFELNNLLLTDYDSEIASVRSMMQQHLLRWMVEKGDVLVPPKAKS